MKIKSSWSRIGIITFTVVFLIVAITFEIIELASLPGQFFGTLLGVVITAIITVLLLQGQTTSEESRERNLLVFEKKQEVFFHFLNQLNAILQKDVLATNFNTDKTIKQNVHNLQDLLFEFGYLQMHTSSETFDKILVYVGNLLEESNAIKALDIRDNQAIEKYYSILSNDFFAIISLLKIELYHDAPAHVNTKDIERIIKLSFK